MNWKQKLPSRERIFAVLFTVLMVTSLSVGFATFGSSPGVVSADSHWEDIYGWEDGTLQGWTSPHGTGWPGEFVTTTNYSHTDGTESLRLQSPDDGQVAISTSPNSYNGSVNVSFDGRIDVYDTGSQHDLIAGYQTVRVWDNAYQLRFGDHDGGSGYGFEAQVLGPNGVLFNVSKPYSWGNNIKGHFGVKIVDNEYVLDTYLYHVGNNEVILDEDIPIDPDANGVTKSGAVRVSTEGLYSGTSGNAEGQQFDVSNLKIDANPPEVTTTSNVSGRVLDGSGNTVGNANVTITEGGSPVTTTQANAAGEWSVSLSNGTYTAEASAPNYNNGSINIEVAGTTTGQDITLGRDTVSGRVVSCPAANPKCANPSGVSDGTVVQLYGVRESNLDSQDPAELREQSEDIRNDMRTFDPEQVGWDPDLALTGSNGEFRSTDHKYVAMHNPSDWALTGWTESPDLRSPLLSAPANEDIILSVWDPTSNSVIQDGVDSELPGAVDDDTDITVKQLDYSGDVVDTRTISTSSTRESLSPVASDHDYARVNLPPGFYLISAEGSPYSYVMTVGDPNDLTQTITDNLETESNKASKQAKEVQNYLDNEKVVKITTTTYSENGEQGHWNTSTVPTDVNVVAVQAYSPSAKEYQIDDVQNASIQDLREVAALEDYNGSFVVTPRAKDVQVPSSGNTIRAVEVDAAPFMDPSRFQNKSTWLQDLFRDSSFAGELSEYLDTSDEDMEEIRTRLEQMKEENEALQSRYAELVEQALDEGESEDGLTNEEVTELIRQAIQELQGDLQPDNPTSGFEDGKASATIPWDGDVDPDALSVTAHFPSLGISQPVPDEFVSVNKRAGRGDVVEITDYPVPEGANAVTFGVTVNGEDGDGIGNTKVTTRNPDFTGDYLNLQSVAVTTIRPGPSEQVAVRPRTKEQSSVIGSVNATVTGPNGEVNATTTADGEAVKFTTDGPGSHRVLMDITDTDGNTWTEIIRLRASSEDVNQPPSVRVREGFTGTFAITSDGITDGSVSTSGASFSATAVADAENVPSAVHFYGSEVSNKHTDVTLRVMKSSGSGEPESARKHVKVFYHTANLPEGAIIYRGEGQPLKVGGETRYGSVTCPEGEDGCTIQTYTEGSGSVDLTVIPHPSVVDRALHWVRLRSPVDLPSLTILPGLGGPLPGMEAVFGGVSS